MDNKTGLWIAAGIAAVAGGWFALSQKSAAAKTEKAAADNAQAVGDAVKAVKAATVGLAIKFRFAIGHNSVSFFTDHEALKKLLEAIPTKKHFAQISAEYRDRFGVGILDDIKDTISISRSEFKMLNAILLKKPA